MDNQNKTYVELLIDITQKKETLLTQIILATMKQSGCLKHDEFDEDLFDSLYREKEKLINEINQLDDGFHQIYKRIETELKINKVTYEKEIKRLQVLIASVTEKGIQAKQLEAANRSICEEKFGAQRRKLTELKVSKKTASMYYKNMMGYGGGQSYLYDKTK